jgi:hypothetical protein
VDDILIMCDENLVNPGLLVSNMNQIYESVIFKPASETNVQIKFLDLLLTRKEFSIEVVIYRKPTTTDTNINFHSNHPVEHKTARYRYFITRM